MRGLTQRAVLTCLHEVGCALTAQEIAQWANAHLIGRRAPWIDDRGWGITPMDWKAVRAACSGMGAASERAGRYWVHRSKFSSGGTTTVRFSITKAGKRELDRQVAAEKVVKPNCHNCANSTCDECGPQRGDFVRGTARFFVDDGKMKAIFDAETMKVGGKFVGTIVGGDFVIDVDLDYHEINEVIRDLKWVTSPDQAARHARHFTTPMGRMYFPRHAPSPFFDHALPPVHGMFNCRGDYVMPKPPMSLFDAVAIARKVLHSAPWPALPEGVSSDDAKRAYDSLARHHAAMPHVVAMDRSDPRYYDSPWPEFKAPAADLIEFQWAFPTAAQIATERRDRGHRVAPTSSRQRLRDTVLAACKEVFGLSGAEAENLRGLRVRATPEQYGRFVALVGGSAVALNTRPEIVKPEVPKQEPVDLTGKGPLTRVTWVP